jgi:hypothetical protein
VLCVYRCGNALQQASTDLRSDREVCAELEQSERKIAISYRRVLKKNSSKEALTVSVV